MGLKSATLEGLGILGINVMTVELTSFRNLSEVNIYIFFDSMPELCLFLEVGNVKHFVKEDPVSERVLE